MSIKRTIAWIVMWMVAFAVEEHLLPQDIKHSFIMILGAGVLSIGLLIEETIENMKVKK